jgi:predicted nucleic acid-binding protein
VSAYLDSSVAFDLIDAKQTWRTWSVRAVAYRLAVGRVLIGPIAYAECCAALPSHDELDAELEDRRVETALRLSPKALHRAASAHLAYRRRGGQRAMILPDFLIGAQAVCDGAQLLTRDAARFRTYFPDLVVIAPDEAP